MFVFSSVHAN